MTGREQTRRDAEDQAEVERVIAMVLGERPFPSDAGHTITWWRVAARVLARQHRSLLAELEQAERREEALRAVIATSVERVEQAERERDEALRNDGSHDRLGPDSPFTLYQRINELNARLVQAEMWANTMEHERDWEKEVVHSELLNRLEQTERERNEAKELAQRLADALAAWEQE